VEKSENKKVQQHIEEIMLFSDEKYHILRRLRKIVFSAHPKAQERMMYGGIMFSLENDFGGIFVAKNHISFEFSNGARMNDPVGLLEGKGEFRRHLKIRTLADIVDKKVDFFVKQAARETDDAPLSPSSTKIFFVKGELKVFPVDNPWYYVAVPPSYTKMTRHLAERGLVAVTVSINQMSWNTSLMPMGDGTQFIPIPAKIRKNMKLKDSVELSFTLRKR